MTKPRSASTISSAASMILSRRVFRSFSLPMTDAISWSFRACLWRASMFARLAGGGARAGRLRRHLLDVPGRQLGAGARGFQDGLPLALPLKELRRPSGTPFQDALENVPGLLEVDAREPWISAPRHEQPEPPLVAPSKLRQVQGARLDEAALEGLPGAVQVGLRFPSRHGCGGGSTRVPGPSHRGPRR